MSALWCELAWLGGDVPERGVLVEVDGATITAVRAQPHPPADADRLRGLTIPGLANAHSHAFQRALRGRTHAGTGSFWTWREQMYALAETIDPDSYVALARATFAEMALAGITVVGEFHYLHREGNAMGEAVIQAAAEAGVRLTLLDACYLRGGLDSFRDADAGAWAARVGELRDSAKHESGSSAPASAYICSRQVQNEPSPACVRPRSARWNACECALARPGSVSPASR